MKLTTFVATLAAANAISFNVYDNLFHSSVPDRVLKIADDSYIAASEADKLRLRREGKRFIDVTDSIPVLEAVSQGVVAQTGGLGLLSWFTKNIEVLRKPIPKYNYPTKAAQQDVVEPLLKKIDIEGVKAHLAKFSSFYTRYYKSEKVWRVPIGFTRPLRILSRFFPKTAFPSVSSSTMAGTNTLSSFPSRARLTRRLWLGLIRIPSTCFSLTY